MTTKNKILLALIILLIFLYTYINNNRVNIDPYNKYQWGLSNEGNFYVSKPELRQNNKIRFFDENNLEIHFIEDGMKDLVIDELGTSNFVYANNNIDINYKTKEFSFEDEVVVALIDTGVDIYHEDLKGKIWFNNNEIISNNIDDDNNGYIDDINGYNFLENNPHVYTDKVIDGHGTHIAGIIAARQNNGIGITGICGDFIKIMPLKVLGHEGNGDVRDLISAIQYAHDNGAKVCNISLGTRVYDEELDNIIKKYDDMIFVVAAGNGSNYIGYDIAVKEVYPASLNYDNVITVSNVSFNGDRYESANYGMNVDIFAPGTYILSIMPEDEYGFITGSSIATPYVTSTVAMMLSINKNIDIKNIKKIIIDTATKINELDNMCVSGGVLNSYEAIKRAHMS